MKLKHLFYYILLLILAYELVNYDCNSLIKEALYLSLFTIIIITYVYHISSLFREPIKLTKYSSIIGIILILILLVSPFISKFDYYQMYTTNNSNSNNNTKIDLSSELVWYDPEKAIEHHLQPKYLDEISDYVAHSLKGDIIQETAWNIVDWESQTIKYDNISAKYGNGIKYTVDEDGNIIDINTNDYDKIHTPQQTIERKKGVCIDYAILTAALLLKNGYQPVYIFIIDTPNHKGHAFAAIKIGNNFYALDQQLPIESVDNHLIDFMDEYGNIDDVYYYKIQIINNKTVVKKYDYDFGNKYTVKSPDSTGIYYDDVSMGMFEKFRTINMNLHRDENIENLDDMKYLPEGYIYGRTYTFEYNDMDLDKNFRDEYAKYFADECLKYNDFKDNIKQCNSIWIDVIGHDDKITIKINLAQKR